MPPPIDRSKLSPIGIALVSAAAAQGHPSLRAAALAWGFRYTHLHDFASGRRSPRLDTLRKLAAAAGVTAADLLAE